MPLAWYYPNGHKVLHVFFFFCQHIHFLFFIFLASPDCQLRHTVEGLDVLVMPDRFVFAKVKLEADSVRQKKWFMIHLLHKSYLFIMNNTFLGAVGLDRGTGKDALNACVSVCASA